MICFSLALVTDLTCPVPGTYCNYIPVERYGTGSLYIPTYIPGTRYLYQVQLARDLLSFAVKMASSVEACCVCSTRSNWSMHFATSTWYLECLARVRYLYKVEGTWRWHCRARYYIIPGTNYIFCTTW